MKEDGSTWEKGGQWLFSCYAPLLRRAAKVPFNQNEENLPGFEDYSPEELRWEAMTSNATGNFQGYVQKLQEMAQKYKGLQRGLQNIDQATADFIVIPSFHAVSVLTNIHFFRYGSKRVKLFLLLEFLQVV